MLMLQRSWVAELLLQVQQPHSLALGAAASCGTADRMLQLEVTGQQLHFHQLQLPASPPMQLSQHPHPHPRTRMGCSFMARPMLPLIFSLRIRNACSGEARLWHVEAFCGMSLQKRVDGAPHRVEPCATSGSHGGRLSTPGRPTHLLRAQLAHHHLHKVVACGAQQVRENSGKGSTVRVKCPHAAGVPGA